MAADWEALRGEYAGHPVVTIEPMGSSPPEAYQVTFRVPGIRIEDDQPTLVDEHRVKVELPLEYPRVSPYCTPLTPVFHPNIGEYYCIGDYWAAGSSLADVIAKIGEMIQYRIYNVASPLDPTAARYAAEHTDLFPIGTTEIRAPDIEVGLRGRS